MLNQAQMESLAELLGVESPVLAEIRDMNFEIDLAISFLVRDDVTLEMRKQRDGSKRWVLLSGNEVLNKRGRWEYEPQPSSRTEAFIERTRFASRKLAIQALNRSEES